jgi:5-methylcytosine-specific restriction enzyme B
MKIWIEKTKVDGVKHRQQGELAFGKVLYSPKTGSDGRDTYKNMRLVNPGDYIIHLIDNKEFIGISRVANSSQEEIVHSNINDLYVIELTDYTRFIAPINRNLILEKSNINILHNIEKNSEVFYQSNLNLRQGAYLTPCPDELFEYINDIYMSVNNDNLPFYDNIAKPDKHHKLYWLYSPGENASEWDKFYEEGIIALGWDGIGDIRQYENRQEIKKALFTAYGGEGSKKNDVSANDDFLNKMNIGDVVIVKKGRGELLGYGIVTSDYYFDENRNTFKSYRKVDWKLKGNWKVNFHLVLKTLTDITKYPTEDPDYDKYYEKLLGIMQSASKIEKKKTMNYPLNTILYGPPGTGKTRNTILRAAQIIENRIVESYQEALDIFKANLHNRIEFITFHQNYSYEDFIQGLRPDTNNSSSLLFDKKDGIFKSIADRAKRNPYFVPVGTILKEYKVIKSNLDIVELWSERTQSIRYVPFRLVKDLVDGINSNKISIDDIKNRRNIDLPGLLGSKVEKYYFGVEGTLFNICEYLLEKNSQMPKLNYVIIIDEINRANISRVFGELITLIEPDKRTHGKIPMEAKLPSGDTFEVPSNLYIIGTMNTADKSIALLDIALRRRFEFEAMYPKYDIDDQEIYDVDILKKINKEVSDLKGHDFQIGHAYFMGENKDLLERMNKKVIPLLLEYFMNNKVEVEKILKKAGLKVEENSWPLKILGKND